MIMTESTILTPGSESNSHCAMRARMRFAIGNCEVWMRLNVCEFAGYTGKRKVLSGEACESSLRGELRGRVGFPRFPQ